MCLELGTSTEVRMRREMSDAGEVVLGPVWCNGGMSVMESGSHREGFRLQTSDIDWMMWLSDHKVICDLYHIVYYSTPQHTMILMECKDLSPGFTRLKMITHSGEPGVKSSNITINGDIYVSSSLFRLRFLDLSRNTLDKSYIQNGPCATVTDCGQETDQAFCLRPHHWPNKALP